MGRYKAKLVDKNRLCKRYPFIRAPKRLVYQGSSDMALELGTITFNNEYSGIFIFQVPFDNINALEKKIDEKTAAIMVETIQGEGGIRPASLNFLEKLKNICIKKNLLFFLDEVQCGFGRSGKLFSYQWSKVEPDVMALAKGIGSGFPMGACLATRSASVGMTQGKHGSTFGGNPLAVAVGKTVINKIMSKGFLSNVDRTARFLWNELIKLEKQYEEIVEIRGAGLLLGIKVRSDNKKINKLLEKKGLLTVTADDNIIRLSPPLIITKKDVIKAIKIIELVFKSIK